jgi:hypothetical protein
MLRRLPTKTWDEASVATAVRNAASSPLPLRRDHDEAPGHVELAELIAVDPPPTLHARRRK